MPRTVEAETPLKYIARGFHTSPNSEVFHSALEIPQFGHLICLWYQFGERSVDPGNYMSFQQYYVCPADSEFGVKAIPQDAGGILYKVGSDLNLHCFEFLPGGLDRNGDLFGGYFAPSLHNS